jgi:hypothetical protein
MTEDEAQTWLQYRQIRYAWKPSEDASDNRWSCRIMRPDRAGIRLYIPGNSAVALLHFIAGEAWAEYPTRKDGVLAEKMWRFFSHEELRELAQEEWSD